MTTNLKIGLSIIAVVILLGFNISTSQAKDFRHHKAHEHGVAHMNVAFEGHQLYIELISPAANIVGFEHHPRSEEQKAAVKKAIEKLEKGDTLFILPSVAGGELSISTIHTDIEGETGHSSRDNHGGQHDETEKGEKDDKDLHHDDHESDNPEQHSEFRAEYHFVCKQPEKLKHIGVRLFRVFPGIERIEVQLLTATKKTALELSAKKNKILF